MEEIHNIIKGVLNEISAKETSNHNKILSYWQKLENGKIAKHTSVDIIKNGQLFINVDSPTWLFQLTLKRRLLEKQMMREIPEISRLHFRIGKVQ